METRDSKLLWIPTERLRRATVEASKWLSSRSHTKVALIALMTTLVVGLLDYVSGYEVSWSVIYIAPIALATWFVGVQFAYALSIFSLCLWLASDAALGAKYSSWVIPVWNSAIRLALYVVFINLLAAIKSLTENLESKVLARTAELERLERELVEIGERERRRIGSDLHDGLGQHLAATALAAQVLRRQLLTRAAPEAEQAGALVTLLEESMTISQKLSKGLQPVEMHGGGLMQALQELASTASDMFKVSCVFKCDAPVLVRDVAVAEQLYRIAQEATTNAVKHGHAKGILLSLEIDERGVVLVIADDGAGFSPSQRQNGGMGLRIMQKRATLIGGSLEIESRPDVGTRISCRIDEDIRNA